MHQKLSQIGIIKLQLNIKQLENYNFSGILFCFQIVFVDHFHPFVESEATEQNCDEIRDAQRP